MGRVFPAYEKPGTGWLFQKIQLESGVNHSDAKPSQARQGLGPLTYVPLQERNQQAPPLPRHASIRI